MASVLPSTSQLTLPSVAKKLVVLDLSAFKAHATPLRLAQILRLAALPIQPVTLEAGVSTTYAFPSSSVPTSNPATRLLHVPLARHARMGIADKSLSRPMFTTVGMRLRAALLVSSVFRDDAKLSGSHQMNIRVRLVARRKDPANLAHSAWRVLARRSLSPPTPRSAAIALNHVVAMRFASQATVSAA
jgi:hypothetical protein